MVNEEVDLFLNICTLTENLKVYNNKIRLFRLNASTTSCASSSWEVGEIIGSVLLLSMKLRLGIIAVGCSAAASKSSTLTSSVFPFFG